jgi:hypothetical protein
MKTYLLEGFKLFHGARSQIKFQRHVPWKGSRILGNSIPVTKFPVGDRVWDDRLVMLRRERRRERRRRERRRTR